MQYIHTLAFASLTAIISPRPDQMPSIRSILITFATLLLALHVIPTSAIATDLYVSSNSGSDNNSGTSTSAPLLTIQKAASLATPGTTIYVGDGTYREAITSKVNGNPNAHIRFVATNKWKAILLPVKGVKTMWSVEGGYTDIDGFQLNGAGINGTSIRVGIYLSGGNSSVQHVWIHNVAENSGCDNQGGGGIVCDQGRGSSYTGYDIIGNLVHNIGGGCGWIQGIYHSSSGSIVNNIVYASSQAINMGHDDHDILVINNSLFGNSGYAVYYGGCAEAYNHGCPTSGIRVHNNIIFNNAGGISGPNSTHDIGNNVSYNLVYNNGLDFDLSRASAETRELGLIQKDPGFVTYIAGGGGDYHLQGNSPVIGKGLLTNAPTVDFDGNVRGSLIDMGAYEYSSAVSSSTASPSSSSSSSSGKSSSSTTLSSSSSSPSGRSSSSSTLSTSSGTYSSSTAPSSSSGKSSSSSSSSPSSTALSSSSSLSSGGSSSSSSSSSAPSSSSFSLSTVSSSSGTQSSPSSMPMPTGVLSSSIVTSSSSSFSSISPFPSTKHGPFDSSSTAADSSSANSSSAGGDTGQNQAGVNGAVSMTTMSISGVIVTILFAVILIL